MKPLLIALPFLLAGLCSCDKAKVAAEAVKMKLGGVTDPGAPAEPGGEVEPVLASQVDNAAEGVRFRRDLDFPSSLEVRVTERRTFKNTRMISMSVLGSEAVTYNGTRETVGVFNLSENRVVLSIEKAGEVLELKKAENESAQSKSTSESVTSADKGIAGTRVEFVKGATGWQIPASKGPVEFNNMLVEQNLLPSLPEVLVGQGVLPRTQWFSSTRRWIGGDKFVIEGETMALLFPGKSSGKVTLTYEAAEALKGHPCGRFAVQGDVSLKGDVSLGGESSDSEITINSGKIWCSLIYPLVLREEYETVQTLVQGKGKGPKFRVQGTIHQVVARQWNP
jgi:hypothetical protein